MRRYAVTLNAEMNITADDEDEAIRNCNSDVREFVAQNEDLEIAEIHEVGDAEELTASLDDIQVEESEVVDPAEDGEVDWTMNGVFTVVVAAESPAEAGELAKRLPAKIAALDEEEEHDLTRYAVALTAEMWITAGNREEAIKNCNDDAREFIAVNDVKVAGVTEVDPNVTELTQSLEDIEFREPEVVQAAKKTSLDWLLNGVYVVVVDAKDPAEAGEIAKGLPQTLPRQLSSGPTI
jgi:hypothetical protein